MLPAIGILTGFAVVVLLFWSPLLVITRLRELFRWPTRWLIVNYLLIGGGLLVGQCLSYLVVILLSAGTGTVTGSDAIRIIGGVLVANLFLPGISALAALRILPARDYWIPEGNGLNGHIALGIGVIWYAVITSLGFISIGLVLIFANLPT